MAAAAPPPPAPGTASSAKSDVAPIFQQLSLTSLRTRMHDLHNTIGRIIHTFHTNPSSNWAEVLAQFSIVNVELLSLVEDIKPILKAFVVYPKNVNASIAPIIPIMLSSKLLPELEAEEAALKEQILVPLSNLTHHAQTEKLQKQIEIVRNVCDIAEKALLDARKSFSLGARQGLPHVPSIDKVQAARLHEQEKLLHAAANFGEGLRISSEQRTTAAALPSHIASALASADQVSDGTSYSRPTQANTMRPTTPQQAQVGNVPQPAFGYAPNSPRPANFNDIQTQQQRTAAKPHFQKQHMHMRPGPIPQMQNVNQQPVQQSLLQQQQPAKLQHFPQSQIQHQLQQQQNAQLHQHIQLQHQQFQQQQLHGNPQNQLQARSQIGNFGNAPSPMLPSNMVTQANMQQRLQQFGMGLTPQSQRSQMLTDPLYASLPMQQQLAGQPNYGLMGANGNLLNSANLLPSNQSNLYNQAGLLNANVMAFGQSRPPPPPQ